MTAPAAHTHRWRFFRAGGFDQVKLETGADLLNLDQLDQKLWVALACPINGLAFDPQTAVFIDTDHDGRIRAPELIAAVKWTGAMLKDPDLLMRGDDKIPLNAIDETVPDAQKLLDSARQILTTLGRADSHVISLADVFEANKISTEAVLNGDGVIVPESAADEATRGIIEEIAACMGTVTDRSGKPGIDQTKADEFFSQCADFDGWMRTAQNDAASTFPLQDQTEAADKAVRAIRAKVDDYFGRCRLAAFDPRAASVVNRKEEDYAAVVQKEIGIDVPEIAGFPLAQAGPGKPLPLQGGVNPAFADAVAALREKAVKPLLGDKTQLTESEWAALQSRLSVFETWEASKAGAAVEKLGIARVRGILSGSGKEKINARINDDKALAPLVAGAADVEKLIRFVRDLYKLCLNFVNFKDLYDGDNPAIFQAGILYLDQRSCHLCLTVEDPARHAAMAGLAGAYLAYLDCIRKGDGEKLSVVAIFSQGDDDNLMVGRNGLFYNRQGRDYDATITKIVASPISIREAFWLPYKKLVRVIEERVVKRATAADANANAQLASVPAVPASTPSAPAPGHSKPAFDPSVVALASLAVGTLAAGFATFLAFSA